jgi:hypothetical protein
MPVVVVEMTIPAVAPDQAVVAAAVGEVQSV